MVYVFSPLLSRGNKYLRNKGRSGALTFHQVLVGKSLLATLRYRVEVWGQ